MDLESGNKCCSCSPFLYKEVKETYVSRFNLILDTPEEDTKAILNPLSGAIDIVDEKTIQFINRVRTGTTQPKEHNNELLEECLEKGYIFHDKTEETEKLSQAVEQWYSMVKALTEHFMVYVTFACNLKCTYCFQKDTEQDKSFVMNKDIIKALFKATNFIHEERGTKERASLTLFGGEPLLRRKSQVEAVEEILLNCSEYDYRVDAVTNGVELSFYCDMLSKYNVECIQVTLDGPKEVHDKRRIFPNGKGSFDRIVKGIDDILEENIPVVIRVNIDEKNIKGLPRLAHFITEKRWLTKGVKVKLCGASEEMEQCFNEPDSRTYKKVFEVYNAHPETKMMLLNLRLPHIFKTVLEHGRMPFPRAQFCWSTSGFSYSLDLLGNIFPCCCINACCDFEGARYGTFYPELNLNRETLETWHNRNVFSLPQCRECETALFCGGGCTRTALHFGRTLREGAVCPLAITKKEIQVVFDYYYSQLKERAGI